MRKSQYLNAAIETVLLIQGLFRHLSRNMITSKDFYSFLNEIENKSTKSLNKYQENQLNTTDSENIVNYWAGVKDMTKFIIKKWIYFKDNLPMFNLFLVNIHGTLNSLINSTIDYVDLNTLEGIFPTGHREQFDSIYYQTAIATLTLIQDSITNSQKNNDTAFLDYIYKVEKRAYLKINEEQNENKDLVHLLKNNVKPLQYWEAVRDITKLVGNKWKESPDILKIEEFNKKLLVYLIGQERIYSSDKEDMFKEISLLENQDSQLLNLDSLGEAEEIPNENLQLDYLNDKIDYFIDKVSTKNNNESISLPESQKSTNAEDEVYRTTVLRETLINSGFVVSGDSNNIDKATALREALISSGLKEKNIDEGRASNDI